MKKITKFFLAISLPLSSIHSAENDLDQTIASMSSIMRNPIEDTLDQGKIIKIEIEKKNNDMGYNIQIHSNSESLPDEIFEKHAKSLTNRDFYNRLQTSSFEKEEKLYTISLYSLPNQDLTKCILETISKSGLEGQLKAGATLSVKKHEDYIRISYQEGREMYPVRDSFLEVYSNSFLKASVGLNELLLGKLKENS